MAVTANLNAWLGLDTKNYVGGMDGAIGKTAALESRLGSAKSSIGSVRSAMGGMASVMGTSTGPIGAVTGAVSNMIHSFQVSPILGFVAAASAAITYFAGQVEKEYQRALDATTRFNANWKRGRDQLREIGLLPQANQKTINRTKQLLELGDEITLLRERTDLYMQAAQLTNTGNEAEMGRLDALVQQVKIYDDVIAQLAVIKDEKKAQELASERAAKAERDAIIELRNRQELVGKVGLDAAQMKLAQAKEKLEMFSDTQIEREQALLEILLAQAEVEKEMAEDAPPFEKQEKAKREQSPEFERLVQLGAILRAPPAASGGSNIAQMQLQEARRQTGILTDIRAHSGRF